MKTWGSEYTPPNFLGICDHFLEKENTTMKKLFALILLALGLSFTPVVKAQNAPTTLPFAATVNATVTPATNYFYLLLNGGNVTTFSLVTPNDSHGFATVQLPMQVIVIFQQDATGSRTVGFATNIKGSPTINATASSYTMVVYQYDSASGFWYAISASTAHS